MHSVSMLRITSVSIPYRKIGDSCVISRGSIWLNFRMLPYAFRIPLAYPFRMNFRMPSVSDSVSIPYRFRRESDPKTDPSLGPDCPRCLAQRTWTAARPNSDNRAASAHSRSMRRLAMAPSTRELTPNCSICSSRAAQGSTGMRQTFAISSTVMGRPWTISRPRGLFSCMTRRSRIHRFWACQSKSLKLLSFSRSPM